jgi:hypothetical protein
MTDNCEPVDIAEETIIIDWATSERGMQRVSRTSDTFRKMKEQSDRALNIAMGNIRSMAWRVTKTMDELEDNARPDEAEVEFGLNLDAEAGSILAKASAGAQLTVKLKWKIEQPERPEFLIRTSGGK